MTPRCRYCTKADGGFGLARRQYIPAWNDVVVYCCTEGTIISGDEIVWVVKE
jgi:hypothetical protein